MYGKYVWSKNVAPSGMRAIATPSGMRATNDPSGCRCGWNHAG